MKAAVHNLLEGRDQPKPVLSDEMITRIGALTEVGVIARTAVQWSYDKRDIEGITQPESNTRLPQQLAALARGAAYLDGHQEVNEDDFALVKRVTFDSMPPARKAIIEALWQGTDLKDIVIARGAGPLRPIPGSTLSYALKDLEELGLVSGRHLTDYARDMLNQAGLTEGRPIH